MPTKERLLEFQQYHKKDIGGQGRFEAHIGIGNGYLSKTKSIGSDVLERLAEKFPDLDMNWLISGKGEMLIKEISVNDSYLENITKLINLNSDLMEKINLKDREKDMLLSQLMELKEKFSKLNDDLDIAVGENKKLTDIIRDLAFRLGEDCPSEYTDVRVRAVG